MLSGKSLILASGSPRRRELISSFGIPFQVVVPDVDEEVAIENPELLVRHLAEKKAEAVAKSWPDHVVLAADTTVAVRSQGQFRILGKPRDEADAEAMLDILQGRTHLVATGFCIVCQAVGIKEVESAVTAVKFRAISPGEIEAYVKSGEPMDKAGAYAAQGKGAALIQSVEGSYTNVVGLPLAEVYSTFVRLGLLR